MRHNHCPEHRSYPATKCMPKTTTEWEWASKLSSKTPTTKKIIKKTHRKRSRQFLKRTIHDDY